MHYLLMYEVAPDYVERRAPLRAAHIKLAREAVERGELVLGGALNPPEGVLLLFRGNSPAAAEAFAAADPYANCDGSTITPALNVADFTCFLQAFAAGCP